MIGKVLGFDLYNNIGTISGEDENRYKFTKESWRENTAPKKGMSVDFQCNENNHANDIYIIKNQLLENTSLLLALVALTITFLFGFIGTFISRLIAKEPLLDILIPTFIHFIITVLLIIPILGWILYFFTTGYYMYKNFIIVSQRTIV